MRARFFGMLLFVSGMASCSGIRQLPPDLSRQKKETFIPFRVDRIDIVDLRECLYPGNKKIPPTDPEKTEEIVNPVLSDKLKNEFMEMIRASAYPEAMRADLKVTIREGYYSTRYNHGGVRTSTRFDCTLTFSSHERGESWSFEGQASHIDSIDYSARHLRKLYKVTVKNSVFTALKRAEDLFAIPWD
jgi:hypothetical protein